MAGKKKWIKPAAEKAVPEAKLEQPPVGSASGSGGKMAGDGKRRTAKSARSALYGEK